MRTVSLSQLLVSGWKSWGDANGIIIIVRPLLFDFLIRLLFVILQVHYGLLGQFQIPLQFSLGSLKVHAELLLLLQ